MKIFSDEEFEEIKPIKDSPDKAIVITPECNGGRIPNKDQRDDIVKEIIADDVKELGKREAALIHGVSASSALDYSNGKGIKDPDVKTRILDKKHGIENIAITKLMETLDLLSPESVEKETDKVKIIAGLAAVIEKVGGGARNQNTNVVHLELHMPRMKEEKDYETIIVSQ